MPKPIMPMNREQTLEAVLSHVSGLIQNGDPRAVLDALLVGAAEVSAIILTAERYNHAQVASKFGQALVDALKPREEAPKIQLS